MRRVSGRCWMILYCLLCSPPPPPPPSTVGNVVCFVALQSHGTGQTFTSSLQHHHQPPHFTSHPSTSLATPHSAPTSPHSQPLKWSVRGLDKYSRRYRTPLTSFHSLAPFSNSPPSTAVSHPPPFFPSTSSQLSANSLPHTQPRSPCQTVIWNNDEQIINQSLSSMPLM